MGRDAAQAEAATMSTGTAPRPTLAVGAIVPVERHLLLVTRINPPAKGRWTVPGGRVETGESMTDAVVREVAEETGLTVECGPLVGWVERIGPGFHFVIFDFLASPVPVPTGGPDALRLTAGDDAGQARWVPFDDLRVMDLVPGLLDFLHEHRVVDPA